jgi:thiamine biosynthesis protein ThiC
MGAEEASVADYCSMCGRHWCSVRINKEIREALEQKGRATV